MKILSFFTLFLLLSCFGKDKDESKAPTNPKANTVVRVADGDTFTYLHEDNSQEKIRLYGIDAPEKKQDFGNVAKKALNDLVYGKNVRIVRKGKDRYQRTLAIVYTPEGICVNEELLRVGLAWHYKKYDNNMAWARLEDTARKIRAGLWSADTSEAPDIFRLSH